jgi:hypothetical protein
MSTNETTVNAAITPRVRKPSKRKFTQADIATVANQCARGLTESEAVRLLGKEPSAWFSFKSRASNDERFQAMLEKLTGERIDTLMKQIEQAGEGIGVKYPDWRASLAALKVISQKRFGDHAVEVKINNAPPISDAAAHRALKRVMARLEAKKREALPNAPALLELPPASTDTKE